MTLDTMLAADIEQQLKPLDEEGRAQFLVDLVEVVHRYASSTAVGEAQVDDRESEGLGEVLAAAKRHADAVRDRGDA
ncbi:hypothetical protein [Microbacterium marinilacus]|uniref:Uncharacterized protein n=1 Tax=Microbacterium marinilacus TaxID=415209 RepID=A0ABP7B852_9MICO|nr:hypothetical protein [Microbacterium marinilacus]MBY0687464.1 hypothetical protein [Microbacterium marinilacus]